MRSLPGASLEAGVTGCPRACPGRGGPDTPRVWTGCSVTRRAERCVACVGASTRLTTVTRGDTPDPGVRRSGGSRGGMKALVSEATAGGGGGQSVRARSGCSSLAVGPGSSGLAAASEDTTPHPRVSTYGLETTGGARALGTGRAHV